MPKQTSATRSTGDVFSDLGFDAAEAQPLMLRTAVSVGEDVGSLLNAKTIDNSLIATRHAGPKLYSAPRFAAPSMRSRALLHVGAGMPALAVITA